MGTYNEQLSLKIRAEGLDKVVNSAKQLNTSLDGSVTNSTDLGRSLDSLRRINLATLVTQFGKLFDGRKLKTVTAEFNKLGETLNSLRAEANRISDLLYAEGEHKKEEDDRLRFDKEHAENLADQVSKELDIVGTQKTQLELSVKNTKANLKLAAAIALVVASWKMLTGLIKSAINMSELGKEMETNAQKALMSTKAYQQWSYAFKKAGVDASKLKESMKQLSRHQSVLEKYGISGGDYETKFKNAVYYIQGMTNVTERASVAMEIFGESYNELMPLLNQSTDDLNAQLEKYQKLRLGVSDFYTQESTKLQAAITDLKLAWQSLKANFIEEILPILRFLVNVLTHIISFFNGIGYRAAKENTAAVDANTEVEASINRVLASFDELEILKFNNTDSDMSDIAADAEEIKVTLWDVGRGLIKLLGPIGLLVGGIIWLINQIKDWFNNDGKGGGLGGKLKQVVDTVKSVSNAIQPAIEGVVNMAAAITGIGTNIGTVITILRNILSTLAEKLGIPTPTEEPEPAAEPEPAVEPTPVVEPEPALTPIPTSERDAKKVGKAVGIGVAAGAALAIGAALGGSIKNKLANSIENTGLLPASLMFADGGVLTQPTYGLMGEYAGARNNPEIVTPQNIMYETVTAANNELADIYIQCTRQLIAAIEENGVELNLDGTTLAKSVGKANRNYKLQTGGSLL